MSDYKAAKEAFVSDNPGSSIWTINAISLVSLTAYTLYAIIARRTRPSPLIDYATTCLPLLLAVSVFATRPLQLNTVVLGLAGVIQYAVPAKSTQPKSAPIKRSKGKWLDESDSDEEPSEPVTGTSSALSRASLSFSERDSRSSSSAPSPIDSSASPAKLSPDDNVPKQRTWKRRHSPTPSTHTHTAIHILPTPENASFELTSENKEYPTRTRSPKVEAEAVTGGRLSFLSVYRSHMMIMTVHCILAVDFPIFPRAQGKCEDFGTSLMDVGVGSFVFSLGIVSIRGVTAVDLDGGIASLLVAVLQALKKSAPILILGLIRVLMVKGTEYPEHVTEYGVHWNFFFTLALVPVLSILLSPICKRLGWTAAAVLVTTCHHASLHYLGLQSWVLSADRAGLIGMNKEGLVSLPGYLAVFFLGLATGQHIMKASAGSERRRSELAMELFGYTIGWWSLLAIARFSGEEVSRRMANLPYVIWIAAYNTTFLLGYLVIELAFFPGQNARYAVPAVLEAVNRNGLVVFLVANLLTGLVNLSMMTMYMGDAAAVVVLAAYSVAVCTFAWFVRVIKINL